MCFIIEVEKNYPLTWSDSEYQFCGRSSENTVLEGNWLWGHFCNFFYTDGQVKCFMLGDAFSAICVHIYISSSFSHL